jgi:hypothetical protein
MQTTFAYSQVSATDGLNSHRTVSKLNSQHLHPSVGYNRLTNKHNGTRGCSPTPTQSGATVRTRRLVITLKLTQTTISEQGKERRDVKSTYQD